MAPTQSKDTASSGQEKQPDLSTQRDIRSTPLYKEVSNYFEKQWAPTFGKPSRASDLQVSPDGKLIAFTGSTWEKLEGQPSQRICVLDIGTKKLTTLTHGPNNDNTARWSPDGGTIAFLSDREEKGDYQLYFLKRDDFGEAEAAPKANGTIEFLEWSPNGNKILLGVAGKDADSAAVGGSGKQTTGGKEELPSWMPKVDSLLAKNELRKLAGYDLRSKILGEFDIVDNKEHNVKLNYWEATWASSDFVFTIASDSPGEEAWYSAEAKIIEGQWGVLVPIKQSKNEPPKQRAVPVASRDGAMIAYIEGIASDRGVMVADVYVAVMPNVLEQDEEPFKLDLGDVDAAYLCWQNDFSNSGTCILFYAGIAGLELVVGKITFSDIKDGHKYERKELFRTHEYSADPYYPTIGVVDDERFVVVLQSRKRYPEIMMVENGKATSLHSFAHEGSEYILSLHGSSEQVSWKAPDGLEIQGILDLPKGGQKPYPLVLVVHGGPIGAYENNWLGFMWSGILLSRGYALFFPNPRGSSGRGQAFVEKELGDVGGGETQDHLSGIDELVKRGIVDPDRIGVTGGSHGGFMASWIVTQDARFKATVPVAAVTHWLSQ